MKKSIFAGLVCIFPMTATALTDEYAQAGQDLGMAATCVQYLGDMEMYAHFERQLIERNRYEVKQGVPGAPNPAEVEKTLQITRPKARAASELPKEVPEIIQSWCDDLRKKMK
ncbi:hypothetical protein [Aliiroseovarius crassostreae]|uniref:hypothetical protein n=1 Tax=Aliiroseovarius crassostreae TaxID=154981 RepID=UPI0021FEFE26|nr:hypothetical protein [Aliiroseovarius crassostreae]UWQ04596.1 hypothetical protein K3X22_13270 [Aliiroseovarius crassostreae]